MISGVHAIVYSKQAEQVREFFRDVLEWPFEDAGRGWLIFALPPAELAVHPAGENSHELYLRCDDVEATVEQLRAKGVDGVISFRDILQSLLASVQTNRNYQKSDLLQTLRLLKNYDLLKEPQLELKLRTKVHAKTPRRKE